MLQFHEDDRSTVPKSCDTTIEKSRKYQSGDKIIDWSGKTMRNKRRIGPRWNPSIVIIYINSSLLMCLPLSFCFCFLLF